MPCFRIAQIFPASVARNGRALFIGLIRKQAAAWRWQRMILRISTSLGNSRSGPWRKFTSHLWRGSCVAVPEQLWLGSGVIEFIAKKRRLHDKADEKRERISKWCAGGGTR